MAVEQLEGRRIPDGTFFQRHRDGDLRRGDYGCEDVTCDGAPQRDWFVVCPDGSTVALWVNANDRNGNRHVVTEHEDGTISVGGSILGHDVESEHIGGGPIYSGTWHGWLEHGTWRA